MIGEKMKIVVLVYVFNVFGIIMLMKEIVVIVY